MAGLTGMKEICNYCKLSESTLTKRISEEDLPAVKIGGIWESDTEDIDQWRRQKIKSKMSVKGKDH